MRSGQASHPRRAFTLVETVTSMAISSILLLAMGSTIVVAARAVPSGDETVIREGAVERGLAVMESDIEIATAITSGPGGIELAVPDRDGDRTPDTITYEWDKGDRMVTRYRNGQAAEELFGPVLFGNVVRSTGDDGETTQVIVVLLLADHTPAARVINVRMLNRP